MVAYDASTGLDYDARRYDFDGNLIPPSGNSGWEVLLGFDLSANGVGDWFTLDDPVKGVLDNVTYLLAGDVLVDVTDFVRSVNVKRGRSKILERFTAGGATITLDNRDRAYDPDYALSPYLGQIVPRKQVRVLHAGYPVFAGNVEDWTWAYSLDGDSVAEVRCVDGFSVLANAVLPAGTATSQLTGARIAAVLDTVSWPAAQRDIDTGQATLDADAYDDGTGALAYLQKVEVSEPGAFFMSRSGMATFRDRTWTQSVNDSGVTFGGTAGIPIVDYAASSITDDMKNDVAVTWYGGSAVAGTATATDATSQAAYGTFRYSVDTLLSSGTQAQDLADYLVRTYKDPRRSPDRIGVLMTALSGTQRAQVLGLELGDAVTVVFTPNNRGSAITTLAAVDEINHDATRARHDVSLTLSPVSSAFVLDDATYGVLDDDVLGF